MQLFDVQHFGAVGDGKTSDTSAIQRAIDAAAARSSPARVLLRGGSRYLVGTLELKGAIDFHLADDAELLISLNPADHREAALVAHNARGLKITGTGSINGRSPEIMTQFDEANEWWWPVPEWRPRLVVLTASTDLEIRGVTIKHAPFWTLHMVGCRRVLVDGIRIRNQLDVPNCDGVVPDHCRDMEIKNCDIICGDDGIVVKSTRAGAAYGESSNISVRDCTIETQDSGLKIGTETTQDIHDVLFERCEIRSSCRGLNIQLRDEGSVHGITFRDIRFKARYHSAPWWGRGEAISLTAMPRSPGDLEGSLGTIRNIRFENVTGLAENSVRICGSGHSRPKNIILDNVAVTLDRWTKYKGGMFDNRPTNSALDIQPHDTPAFFIEHADAVTLKNCTAAWGANRPEYFSHALQAKDVTALTHEGFSGTAAHPQRDPAILVK